METPHDLAGGGVLEAWPGAWQGWGKEENVVATQERPSEMRGVPCKEGG